MAKLTEKNVKEILKQSGKPYSAYAIKQWNDIARNISILCTRGNFFDLGNLIAELVYWGGCEENVPISALWMADDAEARKSIVGYFDEFLSARYPESFELYVFDFAFEHKRANEYTFDEFAEFIKKHSKSYIHNIHLLLYKSYAKYLFREGSIWLEHEAPEIIFEWLTLNIPNEKQTEFSAIVQTIENGTYMTPEDRLLFAELSKKISAFTTVKNVEKTLGELGFETKTEIVRDKHVVLVQNANCAFIYEEAIRRGDIFCKFEPNYKSWYYD